MGNRHQLLQRGLRQLVGQHQFRRNRPGAVNAGSYTVTGSGLYSNQQGYDITIVNGTLTVNPRRPGGQRRELAGNKVYDAATAATLNGTASVTAIAGDTVSVAGTRQRRLCRQERGQRQGRDRHRLHPEPVPTPATTSSCSPRA